MGEKEGGLKQFLLILMSLVFLLITYYVFSNYVFDSKKSSIKLNFLERENTEANIARLKTMTKNIIPIKGDIFKDKEFKSLVKMSESKLEVDNYKQGKINPFVPKITEEKDKGETQTQDNLEIELDEESGSNFENDSENEKSEEENKAIKNYRFGSSTEIIVGSSTEVID